MDRLKSNQARKTYIKQQETKIMTLKELKTKNSDIILQELRWSDLTNLANDAALFYVLLSSKNGPKDDRKVICASQILTVGMRTDYANNSRYLMFTRLTNHGNIKLNSITESDLAANGRAVLFQTAPISTNDPRNNKPWTDWN